MVHHIHDDDDGELDAAAYDDEDDCNTDDTTGAASSDDLNDRYVDRRIVEVAEKRASIMNLDVTTTVTPLPTADDKSDESIAAHEDDGTNQCDGISGVVGVKAVMIDSIGGTLEHRDHHHQQGTCNVRNTTHLGPSPGAVAVHGVNGVGVRRQSHLIQQQQSVPREYYDNLGTSSVTTPPMLQRQDFAETGQTETPNEELQDTVLVTSAFTMDAEASQHQMHHGF